MNLYMVTVKFVDKLTNFALVRAKDGREATQIGLDGIDPACEIKDVHVDMIKDEAGTLWTITIGK